MTVHRNKQRKRETGAGRGQQRERESTEAPKGREYPQHESERTETPREQIPREEDRQIHRERQANESHKED